LGIQPAAHSKCAFCPTAALLSRAARAH
jgi:hypothetical protein